MCVLWSCTGVNWLGNLSKIFYLQFYVNKVSETFLPTLFYCCIIICFFCSYPLVQTQLICEEVNKSHFSAACKRTREEIEEIKSGHGLVNTDIESLRWVYYRFCVNLILLLFALHVHVYTLHFLTCTFTSLYSPSFTLLSSFLSLSISSLLPFFPPFLLLSLSLQSEDTSQQRESLCPKTKDINIRY